MVWTKHNCFIEAYSDGLYTKEDLFYKHMYMICIKHRCLYGWFVYAYEKDLKTVMYEKKFNKNELDCLQTQHFIQLFTTKLRQTQKNSG